jgi:hypothetical protein
MAPVPSLEGYPCTPFVLEAPESSEENLWSCDAKRGTEHSFIDTICSHDVRANYALLNSSGYVPVQKKVTGMAREWSLLTNACLMFDQC